MFKDVIDGHEVPPNFLNSILTNSSLYQMFKDDFEENADYFQGVKKDVYLDAMHSFLIEELFSRDLFQCGEVAPDDTQVIKKISYFRNFYDDFMLEKFKEDPQNILKTKFFRGLNFALENDQWAKDIKKFRDFYDYVFEESIDYFDIIKLVTREPFEALKDGQVSIAQFDTICNYIKNNASETLEDEIIMRMIDNHAHKKNRIFDREVAKELAIATANSYLQGYNLKADILFVYPGKEEELDVDNKIVIDAELLDKFTTMNYVELFQRVFYEIEIFKIKELLKKDNEDLETYMILESLIIKGVDIERFISDPSYEPKDFLDDLWAFNFVRTLRFFKECNVDLFDSYTESQMRKIDFDGITDNLTITNSSNCIEDALVKTLKNLTDKDNIINKHKILRRLYNKDGTPKDALELIKNGFKDEKYDLVREFLHSRIVDPIKMIDEVAELSSFNAKNDEMREFIETELKYFYVDAFIYSLEENLRTQKDKYGYLEDLSIKISLIKDTPLTSKFIDEVKFDIEEAKQNLE